MTETSEVKTGELFCGAGGLGIGFVLAGNDKFRYRPIFAIDNHTDSLKSYSTNMRWLIEHGGGVLPAMPQVIERDIEKLNVAATLRLVKMKRGELDLLLGGPPCQGFSTSNRISSTKVKRNRLVHSFLERLNAIHPKMFLFENVQGLRWTKPTSEMQLSPMQEALLPEMRYEPTSVKDFIIRRAAELGYKLWYGVLDAVDYGVPQHRIRFFILGLRSDLAHDLDSLDLSKYLERYSSSRRLSVGEAIGDLPCVGNGQAWSGDIYQPCQTDYVTQMRRFMTSCDLFDHFTTKHAEYVIERYKKIPAGGNWQSIRDEMSNYKNVENTHYNIYRRLDSSRQANTISHYRKSMVIHPTQDRGISFREACRLQSFPDWFRFSGGIDNQQQQLANAVPPLMAEAVAHAIRDFWLERVGN